MARIKRQVAHDLLSVARLYRSNFSSGYVDVSAISALAQFFCHKSTSLSNYKQLN